MRLLGRTAEAEDVVQDAFVTAFLHLAELKDRTRFEPWLTRIAVREVHRRYRRRRLRRALGLDRGDDDGGLAAAIDSRADPALARKLSELDGALSRLPTLCRTAWLLRYLEHCELRDIAEQCDCSLATVKRQIGKAEALLAEYIDHVHVTDPPEGEASR
jgi:RNA polymerase sigma-70 factor (ECF subfamily)